MEDPDTACTDLNILAFNGLASNGGSDFPPISTEGPSQGPLKSLQSLNAFDLNVPVPVHVHTKLVELRGGLGNIQLPRLAAIIS
jgi:hypothetical protein